MRLPNTAHTAQPWRIHELTPDFRLEDVWALQTPGGPDDFHRLVEAIAAGDPSKGSSRTARALWTIRWKLGELLGWDDPDTGLGSRVPTLRDRLPPRPDGGVGTAEWFAREDLHGRDPAVSPSDRLPGSHARDRAAVAGSGDLAGEFGHDRHGQAAGAPCDRYAGRPSPHHTPMRVTAKPSLPPAKMVTQLTR